MATFGKYFASDFIYCFYQDFKDDDFPKPPSSFKYEENRTKLENWYNFLKKETLIPKEFLYDVNTFLQAKNIKLILILDQDNILQKSNPPNDHFLVLLKICQFVDLAIISASNSNEGFKQLSNDQRVLTLNHGFSKDECKTYITEMKQLMKIEFDIPQNDLFQLTGGNGYLLNRFMTIYGNNFEEKFNNYYPKMCGEISQKIEKFKRDKLKDLGQDKDRWFEIVLKFLIHLNVNKYPFPYEFNQDIDQNCTYLENQFLKGVSPLTTKIFFERYLKEMEMYGKELNKVENLYDQMVVENITTVRDVLFERYILFKLWETEKNEFNLKCYYSLNQILVKKFHLNSRKMFTNKYELKQIIVENKDKMLLIIPHSYCNRYFDFLILNQFQNKDTLYMFQITTNLMTHKSSDIDFFDNNHSKKDNKWKFCFPEKDIQFVWISLNDDLTDPALWQKVKRGSWIIKFNKADLPNKNQLN